MPAPRDPSAPLSQLALGPVVLRSPAPGRLLDFYQEAAGLAVITHEPGALVLGAGGRPLVEVRHDPGARAPVARAPGLFHLAIRVPDRRALADRLMAVSRLGLRLGAADHLVSEALYIDDPDGNGVEIYRDRPPADWPRTPHGAIAMATQPLDLAALAREAPPTAGPAPIGTDMGHVHLKVADLDAARAFWVDLVGLAIMARYPGALFLSAGGYHHHLGLNTWQSAGAPARVAGACGLDYVTVRLPQADLDALSARLAGADWPFATREGGLDVADPSGNAVRVRPMDRA